MTLKRNRSSGNRFFACTGYPECKWTCEYDEVLGVLSERIVDLEAELAKAKESAPKVKPRVSRYKPTVHKYLKPVKKGEPT